MPFKLVVCDFDGTLVDSLDSSLEIFNRLAGELRYRPIDDPTAARSMSTRQFLKHHGISIWRLPRLVRRFHAAAAERAEHLRLHAGILQELEHLHRGGIRLGILSSNKEENIRRTLRANAAEECFAFVVGYPKLFGKGRALKRIVKAERLSASEVLYVGDEVRDVEAARKARVGAAAVTWGFHAEKLLQASSPDYLVGEPALLRAAIEAGRSSPEAAA
jgi:phosphoglycolate phosphatase